MGLNVTVGILAAFREDDPDAAEDVASDLAYVNTLLAEAGLPQHVEPVECEVWDSQMYGYSGLHYLRRIAAYIDAGLPLPGPGDSDSSEDAVLEAYFNDVASPDDSDGDSSAPAYRFERGFDHLIVHSDADGFYVPVEFDEVIFADDELLPGGMLGSTQRLLAELERLAAILQIPAELDPNSEALWEATESQGQSETTWERYAVESFSCVVLREACRKSLVFKAAITFC